MSTEVREREVIFREKGFREKGEFYRSTGLLTYVFTYTKRGERMGKLKAKR